MIRACIFDLDGTLLDTLPTIKYALNNTLREFGRDEVSTEETKSFVGKGARILLEKAFLKSGELPPADEFDRILEKYVAGYDNDPSYLTVPYEGISEAIKQLKEMGILLGVASNKPHSTVELLVNKFFPGAFDVVRGAMDDVKLKPEPDMAELVCRDLSVPPEQTLYFGDTAIDIKTAKAYGARAGVGVLWGFRTRAVLEEAGADLLLDHASKIPSLVKLMNS